LSRIRAGFPDGFMLEVSQMSVAGAPDEEAVCKD
jgi:hypothetical protein